MDALEGITLLIYASLVVAAICAGAWLAQRLIDWRDRRKGKA